MDRVAQFNVMPLQDGRWRLVAMSIPWCWIDGTITLGNRLERSSYRQRLLAEDVAKVALAASVFDETPEGKSIVRLAEKIGATVTFDRSKAEGIEFSAKTRMSGTNLPDGGETRKER